MNALIMALAVWGLIASDHLIRKIMCLSILESMIILAFLSTGFAEDCVAPILHPSGALTVDPVPQALMLTAIVIGVCFNALARGFLVRVHQQHGTLRASEIHEY
ncbi:MAG: cation:proton antiporter subunit C [Kiritimatiellia bacterium]|nr:cation:proton antiporter subunit C [Kiritimatiellia bacterium]